MSEGKTEASIYQQAEDGKTELSLMHFAITNPQWQPPQETTHFISQLKERVHREATGGPSDTHPLSLSESEVLLFILRFHRSYVQFNRMGRVYIEFSLVPFFYL